MSIQIAVRLPDELVQFVDAEVAAGRIGSRAEMISRLLAKEARHRRALADLEILRAAGVLRGGPNRDELDGIAAATSRRPLDFDSPGVLAPGVPLHRSATD